MSGNPDTRSRRTAIVAPSHDLLRQMRAELRSRGCEPRYERSPLSVLSPDGSPVCRFHEVGKALAEAGGYARTLVCRYPGNSPCPHLETCPAAEAQFDGDPNAHIMFAPYALLDRAFEFVGDEGLLV